MPKEDPSSRQKGAIIRMTMFDALGDRAAIKTELDALDTSPETSAVLDKLARTGCDRSFVLQTTFLYAYLLYAQESNREQEKETRPEHRRLALIGLSWTVEDLKGHVERCKSLSGEIEAFLNSARIPGGNLRDSADVFFYHSQLPGVLRRYADFALEIGKMTQVNLEVSNKKLSCLVLLVRYLKDRTGHPQFASLVALLEVMRQISVPFTSEISVNLLRKQYRRAEAKLRSQPVRPQIEER